AMKQKLAAPPQILRSSAGGGSCCIFRVPQSLKDVNGSCYEPHVVSVGPYHHGAARLRMIEEHKWRFLAGLLKRMQQQKNSKGIGLEDLLGAVRILENPTRECYSSAIEFSGDELAEMMVLDGCFVIEILRKFGGIVAFEADDPLLSVSWVLPFFLRDFIRIENQVPFFILQSLFDLTQQRSGVSLPTLALKFFNNLLLRPETHIEKFRGATAKHLLDLLRSSFIPPGFDEPPEGRFSDTRIIHSISKLRRAGIRLRSRPDDDGFLAVRFRRGVISMPTITIDDFTSCFLQNCVVYEQSRRASTKHVTAYVVLLDCLINTADDVGYLCDKNIVENYFGTDGEIARLINNLGKDVSFDVDRFYLSELFNEVNGYYRNYWHVQWASFKYTYFQTPWSFISAAAAFVLLCLTVAQTLYTVLGYVKP
ncbi:hypothetical protein M569_14510, partial [Genlisea aurea]